MVPVPYKVSQKDFQQHLHEGTPRGNPSYALLSTSVCSNTDAIVPSPWDGLIYMAKTVANWKDEDRRIKTASVSFSQPIG